MPNNKLAPASGMTAEQVFDRVFLEVRSKLLDIAAALDRIDRADGTLQDQRMAKIEAAVQLLLSKETGRAEALQRLFSRPYDAEWLIDFEQSLLNDAR